MNSDAAEALALKALGWLAANEDLLPVFLGSAGLNTADLREAARDPGFLGGVLDFILMDDAWVMGFCRAEGYEPAQPMQARACLPGGGEVHWT